ncbi:MAG: hypothetical protein WDZ90_01805 [Candidatus Paceibacterota bacterium]
MSWRSKMQALYLGGVLLFLAVVVGIPTFIILNEQPSCFDDIQNGDERGVDCGGMCEKVCTADTEEPTLLWSRSFRVTDSVYNAVAYVENTNFEIGTEKIQYRFTLFDDDNVLIAERRGETFLEPNKVVPIFEGGIRVGNRTPRRTFFEFSDANRVLWKRDETSALRLSLSDERLVELNGGPRLQAKVRNDSTEDLRNVEVVAIIFNASGNAFAASKTVIELLPKRSDEAVVFTWPEPFFEEVARIEITPRINK